MIWVALSRVAIHIRQDSQNVDCTHLDYWCVFLTIGSILKVEVFRNYFSIQINVSSGSHFMETPVLPDVMVTDLGYSFRLSSK